MSRKIKVQTVNTKNLEQTLRDNLINDEAAVDFVEVGDKPSAEVYEKTKEIMRRFREEDNNPCNQNIGDANADTIYDNSSTVVNINDIKTKNLIDRFNDIILDVTSDDFTDDMSIDEKNIKSSRQKGFILEEDFKTFMDIINIEKNYTNVVDVPIYIESVIADLHGMNILHEIDYNSDVYCDLANYYEFLLSAVNLSYDNITKDSYYVKLADHYINHYNKPEFNVSEDDLNQMSQTAATNYNVINDRINDNNNTSIEYKKCREYFNSKDTVRHLNKDLVNAKAIAKALREKDITSPKELIDKVLSNNTQQPGEFVISIPQDYETTMEEINNKTYEHVNHPSHYNNYDKEVIDMMIDIWGKEQTAIFCKLNAFKYRMRMGTKPDNDISQDLNKEKWYLKKYRELININ